MGNGLSRLPNPFEEMGVPIEGFCRACWVQVLLNPPMSIMRNQAIDMWWSACEDWLKDTLESNRDDTGNTT